MSRIFEWNEAYDNHEWRAAHGYSHKPVQSFRVKDHMDMQHHDNFMMKYLYLFGKGAVVGICLGQAWMMVRPMSGFAIQKMMAQVGEREWSGQILR